jgi:hypothetical protein
LGLREGETPRWTNEDSFTVEVAETVEDLEARLVAKMAEGYSARMTAGYCWRWSDPQGEALVPDVQIGTWSRPWNSKGVRRLGDAPPSALWATDDGGFGQVGCVYTAQGFEYDWNGVIFGPDLVVRDGKWVSRREYNKDPDFKSRKTVSDADFDRLVRHVYKVLLTRGMIGTVLYSTDGATLAYLREQVG